MLKNYFTDSLIQIAIVLSLLRTDLHHYLNSNLNDYPEVQEIMLGPTAAYTQTQFHHNQWLNSFDGNYGSGSIKSIDNYYAESMFHDLNALNSQSMPVPQHLSNIATWLFVVGQSTPLVGITPENETNNETSDSQNELIHNDINNSLNNIYEDLVEGAALPYESESDENTTMSHSEISNEDADLIEVLWRQDMDLGVGREMFDLEYRQQMEKDKEIALHKEKEKETQELQKQEQETGTLTTDSIENYIVDGETGELVYAPSSSATSQSAGALDAAVVSTTLDVPTMPLTLEGTLQILAQNSTQPSVVPPPQAQLLDSPANASMDDELQALLDSVVDSEITEDPSFFGRDDHLYEKTLDDVSDIIQLNNSENSTFAQPAEIHTNATTISTGAVQGGVVAGYAPLLSVTDAVGNLSMCTDEGSSLNDALISNATLPVVNNEQSFQQMLELLPMNNSQVLNDTLTQLIGTITEPSSISTSLTPTNTATHSGSDFLTSMAPPSNLQNFTSDFDAFNNGIDGSLNASNLLNELMNTTYMNGTPTGEGNHLDAGTPPIAATTLFNDVADNMSNASSGYQGSHVMDDTSSEHSLSYNPAYTPLQDFTDSDGGVFDGIEGATGGATGSGSVPIKREPVTDQHHYSRYGGGATASGHYGSVCNSSISNTTSYISADPAHISHNHTYQQQVGLPIRETKYTTYKKQEEARIPRQTMSRDERRAKALKVPLNMHDIIETSCERFSEILQNAQLNDAQEQLVRDIRRRGKNKVAAQNCRKRKLDVVLTLEDEVLDLHKKRDDLYKQQEQLRRERDLVKNKMQFLQNDVFSSLRDENGLPYDPAVYTITFINGKLAVVPIKQLDDMLLDREPRRQRGSRRSKKGRK